jgi:signal peptidase I
MLALNTMAGIRCAMLRFVYMVLVFTNSLRFYSTPTEAMKPTLSKEDNVMMEGASYLFRNPHRGDVVVFKGDLVEDTSGFRELRGEVFVKRVAGEPGDRVRISNGRLYINDEPVHFCNAVGEIPLVAEGSKYLTSEKESVTVPMGQYFVLGDNSHNSFDSRYFGFVKAEGIMGRVVYCYWPPERMGAVR